MFCMDIFGFVGGGIYLLKGEIGARKKHFSEEQTKRFDEIYGRFDQEFCLCIG